MKEVARMWTKVRERIVRNVVPTGLLSAVCDTSQNEDADENLLVFVSRFLQR